MAVTIDDVRHIAALARVGLSDARAAEVVGELNLILGHMEVLSRVNTNGVQEAIGVGARGLPARGDHGPGVVMERSFDTFAPRLRDGLLLVPRLSTHETSEEV